MDSPNLFFCVAPYAILVLLIAATEILVNNAYRHRK